LEKKVEQRNKKGGFAEGVLFVNMRSRGIGGNEQWMEYLPSTSTAGAYFLSWLDAQVDIP
jgi:hypothetical protein